MKFHLNKIYFLLFLLLIATEALIAIYLKDGFIRHTFGDFLVVILIYCFLKSFWNSNPIKVALVVLVFSFTMEFLQYFNLLKILHLENNLLAKLVLGNTFQVNDLIAYCLGIVVVLFMEIKLKKIKSIKKQPL